MSHQTASKLTGRIPTAQTLLKIKGVENIKTARAIRKIIESTEHSCFVRMRQANVAMDIAYGVEYIQAYQKDGRDSSLGAYYINMGDTYDITLIYDFKAAKFIVGSWGDMVERAPSYRFTSPSEREGNKVCR